jgi:hypothetical protein
MAAVASVLRMRPRLEVQRFDPIVH